jgi:hypothetical protein
VRGGSVFTGIPFDFTDLDHLGIALAGWYSRRWEVLRYTRIAKRNTKPNSCKVERV